MTVVQVVVLDARPVHVVRHLLTAEDLRHARDRPGAATARAVLAVLGVGPVTQVCATCGGPHGRPTAGSAHVSVSYAGDLLAVAVGEVPVGVDVELETATAFDGFASVALGPGERPEPHEQAGQRALAWVRKEAVLKATGDGLRVDPRQVRVDGGVVRWAGAPGPVALARLTVPSGWAGALAALTREALTVRRTTDPLPPCCDV